MYVCVLNLSKCNELCVVTDRSLCQNELADDTLTYSSLKCWDRLCVYLHVLCFLFSYVGWVSLLPTLYWVTSRYSRILLWFEYIYMWTNYESRLFDYWWGIFQFSIFIVLLGWCRKDLQWRCISVSSGWRCEEKLKMEIYYKKKENILKLKYLHFL